MFVMFLPVSYLIDLVQWQKMILWIYELLNFTPLCVINIYNHLEIDW